MLCNRIGSIMICGTALIAIARGFESWSVQTEDYENGIYCFSAKQAALRTKGEYWLTRIGNSVSEWSDMFIRGLLFK